MPAPPIVIELVRRFADHRDHYTQPEYKEARLRQEFLDAFFGALGWDVGNTKGYSETFKEVVIEDVLRIEGAAKAPDYAFGIGGTTQFYAEAKKPSVSLKDNPEPAFQLRRYAWTKKLAISVLTDFQEFAIYDTRVQPEATDSPATARIAYFTFDEYPNRWDELAALLSKEAIQRGAIERFAAARGTRRGYAEVDDVFLRDIEAWRQLLAREVHSQHPTLMLKDLNFFVQRTLDRIVFLRICEDRGLEPFGRLSESAGKSHVYERLKSFFQDADNRYNSGLFHFREERGRAEQPDGLSLKLSLDDGPLRTIIRGLYTPHSPYAFNVLPADILGQVYERFLGNTIVLKGRGIAVEPKPEVRAAGGVFYTPTFVVNYIVRDTLGYLLEGKSLKEIETLAVLDPACGSGSFLLQAYEVLLDWYLEWFTAKTPERFAKGKAPTLRETVGGGWRLTPQAKKRILLQHIHGVDIDSQAVEVTKLSLLLRVLEGETQDQLDLLHERALPDLGNNIKCGNSLIEPDFYHQQQLALTDDARSSKVNAFAWKHAFPTVFARGGFDVVIGNPPYVLLQDQFRDDEQLAYFRDRYRVAAYKIDTYHLFMERGIALTKPGGRFGMITPTNFITNNYLAELRRLLLQRTRIADLLIIEKGVFDGISVDNAILVVEHGVKPEETFTITNVQPAGGKFVPLGEQRISVAASLADKYVLFTGTADPALAKVWAKVEAASVPLGAIADVNFGKQLRDRTQYTRDVIEVRSLRSVPGGYAPCYTGTDVGRYSVQWGGLACRTSTIARRGGCWDEQTQNGANKLLTKQIGRVPQFGIDKNGYQCLNTIFMVTLHEGHSLSPLFVLACLNSRLVQSWWLDKFFDRRRTFPKIKGAFLERLPIPGHVTNGAQAAVSRLAERRIVLANNLATITSPLERERYENEARICEGEIEAALLAVYDVTRQDMETVETVLGPLLRPD